MAGKPSVTIVGPGNLGSALARSLIEAGYRIGGVVFRGRSLSPARARQLAREVKARAESIETARLDTEIIWFCVPDREISRAARALASRTDWEGKIALHSSGALASDELQVLRRRGSAVASLHPLMTFVRGSHPQLAGVPFGFEGDRRAAGVARRIVKDLKGEFFVVAKEKKAAYHAWGAFTSPLLLTALVSAEEAAEVAGLERSLARRKMLPIVRQTIENYASLGPEAAVSGPLVRGDVETVSRHLQALRGSPARAVYVALARAALRNLPVRNRRGLEQLLRNRSGHKLARRKATVS
jgi:predicted short-subunit dehydrogenase-like oxidoreductase (DUF2520 family)